MNIRALQRLMSMLLIESNRLLISERLIEREAMLSFFRALAQENPLVYALLLQQNRDCYYELSMLEILNDRQLLRLLASVSSALSSPVVIRDNPFLQGNRGELRFSDINNYYLNSWGGVVPPLFRDAVVRHQPSVMMPHHLHGHPPSRVITPSSPQIHGHFNPNAGYHQHHMFAQGPRADMSRPRSQPDMPGSRGPASGHFHGHR